jgi:hypothetical protein
MKIHINLVFGLTIISLIQISCHPKKNNSEPLEIKDSVNKSTTALTIKDTVTGFNAPLISGTHMFKTPKGNFILFDVSNEDDSLTSKASEKNVESKTKTNSECEGPDFDGSYRKIVKYTPSKKSLEIIDDAGLFFTQLASTQTEMCNKRNSLPVASRSIKENRNVQFKTVYLYTFKRQSDEDYHVIFGTTNNISTAKFFNAEISGLSPVGTYGYDKLLKVRTDFETYFHVNNTCRNSYYKNDFRKHPIKICLSGSLFYDGEHCKHYQDNGPQNWKTMEVKVAWEIHPITGIEFLE